MRVKNVFILLLVFYIVFEQPLLGNEVCDGKRHGVHVGTGRSGARHERLHVVVEGLAHFLRGSLPVNLHQKQSDHLRHSVNFAVFQHVLERGPDSGHGRDVVARAHALGAAPVHNGVGARRRSVGVVDAHGFVRKDEKPL